VKRGAIYAAAIVFGLAFMSRSGQAKVDAPADPFAGLQWVKGGPVDIRENIGDKVYLVEFWATWCPPCIESAPHLTKLQKELGNEGLVVIGITDEEPEHVRHFLKENPERMGYVVASDTEYQTFEKYLDKYKVASIPTAFVIDRRGHVVWYGSPFDPEMEDTIRRAIRKSPAAVTEGSESADSESGVEK